MYDDNEKRFSKYMKADRIKGILSFILIFLLMISVVFLGIKLSRQTSIDSLGFEDFSVGQLEVVEKEKEDKSKIKVVSFDDTKKTSISTKGSYNVDGLNITIDDDAKVVFELFFFDKDENYISSVNSSKTINIPENAETFKIMITPIVEEGETENNLNFFTKYKVADSINVIFDR